MMIIDIETIPDIDVHGVIEELDIKAPSNYKDESKIASYIEEARAKAYDDIVKQASLSKAYGRVVAVAYILPDKRGYFVGDEKDILTKLINLGTYSLYTYNGKDFDIPYLNFRCKINGLNFSYLNHFDIYLEIAGYRPIPGYLRHDLKSISQRFGYPSDTSDIDGSWVYSMYLAGKLEEIGQYCLQDCERLEWILKKMNEV